MSSLLPDGWAKTNIDEISDRIHYGFTAKSEKKPIGTKLLRITDIQNNNVNWDGVPYCKISDGDKKKYLLEPNDLVFARTGATVGKSYLIPQKIPESVFASYLIRVILNSNISPKYIYNFFQSYSYWIQIKEGSAGIGQPNVNATKLSKIKLPLPPLSEQKRIVSKIEELLTRLDAGIESLKQVQVLLKKYRQSVLKSAVEGKLTSKWHEQHKDELEPADKLLESILKERKEKWEAEQLANFKANGKKPPNNWQDKYKEPTPPNTSNLPELLEGWVWVSLDQITGDSQIGLVRSKSQQNSKGKGFTYLKMNNLTTDGRVLFDDVVFVAAAKEEGKRYSLKKNDIIFNTRNSKELVGKTGLVRTEQKDVIYNNNLMRIRTVNGAQPEFILQQMCSLSFKERMERIKRATTNVAAIYAKDLMPLPLALPSEKEQKKIMSLVDQQFSVIEKLEDEIIIRLIQSQSLRQSILKHAFEGKLVPQDPNDEPASVLLEKIKAEKSNPKKSKQMEMF